MGFRGVDHIGKIGDDFLERRVAVDGVFPDLEGEGTEIDFVVGLAVENSGLLREQIAHGLFIRIVLEERLVSSDNLRILPEPLTDTGTKPDDSFNAVGRKKAVAEDILRLSDRYDLHDRPAGSAG